MRRLFRSLFSVFWCMHNLEFRFGNNAKHTHRMSSIFKEVVIALNAFAFIKFLFDFKIFWMFFWHIFFSVVRKRSSSKELVSFQNNFAKCLFSKCTAKSDPNAWNTRSLVSRYCIWASASNFVFIMLLMIISNNQHCARFFITVFDKVLGALCLKLKTRPMRISNNNNDGEKWMVWIWRDLNYVPLCIRIYSVRGACWMCVSARERNLEMEWQKIARERDFCFCFRQSERHSFCYFRFLSFVISHWLHTKRKLWLFSLVLYFV